MRTQRAHRFAAVFLFLSSVSCLFGQELPPRPATATIVTPLGETGEAKMILLLLDLEPAASLLGRTHSGAIFAYVVEGEIECRTGSGPAEVFRPGSFFHQPAGQAEIRLSNVSKSAPAKILMLQNSAALPNGARPLLQGSLDDLADLEVTFGKIVSAPGDPSPPAHQHPGPAFAYLMKGEVESQVEPGEPKIYHAGDAFSELPTNVHRFYRNLSLTESAELLLFVVRKKGQQSSRLAK